MRLFSFHSFPLLSRTCVFPQGMTLLTSRVRPFVLPAHPDFFLTGVLPNFSPSGSPVRGSVDFIARCSARQDLFAPASTGPPPLLTPWRAGFFVCLVVSRRLFVLSDTARPCSRCLPSGDPPGENLISLSRLPCPFPVGWWELFSPVPF